MEQKITRKTLENGNLLRRLKHTFLTTQNRHTLMPVLACLRDSEVIVPVRVNVSDADKERILSAEKGKSVATNDKVNFEPSLLGSDDGVFLPIFSNAQQLKPDYSQRVTLLTIPAVQAMKMALSIPNINGLVLDAFTEAMLIPKESAELILKMKSRLQD